MSALSEKYCAPNNEKCKNNMSNIASFFESFDEQKAILQGEYLKHQIGMHNIVNLIYKKHLQFNVEYVGIKLYAFESDEEKKKIGPVIESADAEKIKLTKYIQTLATNTIYLCDVFIPGHANIIYLDNHNKTFFYYEPHLHKSEIDKLQPVDKFPYKDMVEQILLSINYTKIKLPNYVLYQTHIPLCYLYTLHFCLAIFIQQATNTTFATLIGPEYDNTNIMHFGRFILKLCNIQRLITNIDYYVLTNNVYKLNNYYVKLTEPINNLLVKNCNLETFKLLHSKFPGMINLLNMNDMNMIERMLMIFLREGNMTFICALLDYYKTKSKKYAIQIHTLYFILFYIFARNVQYDDANGYLNSYIELSIKYSLTNINYIAFELQLMKFGILFDRLSTKHALISHMFINISNISINKLINKLIQNTHSMIRIIKHPQFNPNLLYNGAPLIFSSEIIKNTEIAIAIIQHPQYNPNLKRGFCAIMHTDEIFLNKKVALEIIKHDKFDPFEISMTDVLEVTTDVEIITAMKKAKKI